MDASERRKSLQEMEKRWAGGDSSSSASTSSARRAKLAELEMARAQSVIPEITSRVDTWLENNKTYFSNAQKRFSGENAAYRTDTSEWMLTVVRQRANFQKEAENIKSVLNQYKDVLGQEYVNSVYEALDGNLKAQESIIDASNKDHQYWAQWSNKDEYDTAVRYNKYQKKYEGKGYDEVMSLLGQLKDGEEKEWLNARKYDYLANEADFKEYSQKGASIVNPSYHDAEGLINIFGWRPGTEDVGNVVTYSRDNADKIFLQEANLHDAVGDYRYSFMTDSEVNAYNYYLGKYGEEKASEFLASIDGELTDRYEGKVVQAWQGIADESPVMSSLVSPVMSVFSGAEYLADLIKGDDRNLYADINTTIRGTVSEKVDWEIGNWDAFDFVYNTGMSMADSLVNTTLFGGFGGVSLGLSAAAQATNDALDRGLTKDQAFWNGITAGVFEGLFETVSIGSFKALQEVSAQSVKDIAKNIGKSMLVNASEEALTEIANITYDLIANGELSNFEINVRYYMEQGMSEAEAKHKAAVDLAHQVVESAASGALMGVGMGGIATAGSSINSAIQGADMKKTFGSDIGADLAAEAVEIDPNNPFAQKMKAKVDRGETLSNRQVGNLVRQNETAMYENDVASIQSAVEQRLTELGQKGNIKKLAEAITKKAVGEGRSVADITRTLVSKYGQLVSKELNPDNIRAGKYNSAWAEKIGTDRINAEEYGKLLKNLENEHPVNQDMVYQTKYNKAGTTPEAAKPVETADNVDVATQETASETQTAETPENVTAKETATEAATEGIEAKDTTATLESASAKYGAQAGAMVRTYTEGQDVAKYDAAYSAAYEMGKSGVNLSYAMQSESTAYLTEKQRELAHAAGADAANATAKTRDAENKAKANGNTGRKKGAVKGEGVTISDLKKSFNDTQGKAYKLLSTYAEATGVDIVLYKSEANADGRFEGAQGKFKWSEDTIYIDINAGLATIENVDDLMNYTMMRTFSHEFSHFIEKWNPVWYNEFRKVVFDTLTERGEDVNELISFKKKQSEGMTYDQASREVVAEAMTDILTDANFVEELATKHKTIFAKLFEMLKEFVADLKAHFASLANNGSIEANALKEQIGDSIKYVENIVKMFDKIAVEAVENYQMTVATEEAAKAEETAKVEEPAKVEKAAEKESNKPTVETYDEFTVEELKGGLLFIDFKSKPSEAAIKVLEEYKIEWIYKNSWYGTGNSAEIAKALQAVYAVEEVAEAPVAEAATDTLREMGGKAVGDNMTDVTDLFFPELAKKEAPKAEAKEAKETDAYDDLTNKLLDSTLVKENGLDFSISGNDKNGYYGTIKRQSERLGAYPVENARDRIYRSGLFDTYKEAVDDIVLIAKISELLKVKEQTTNKEVKPNVENADNQGTVQQPDTDRAGDPRVLDEVEAGNVQGDAPRGDSVGDSVQHGQEAGRDGSATDNGAGTRSGSSDGDSQSRDLRRDDVVTPEAERLHEEVTEQIAQQSTEQPKGRNFVIGDGLDIPSGDKAKYKANIDAIKLVRQLETEGRHATEAEQQILSKYVGWGGLSGAFDQRKAEWSKEYNELKELLTDEEYRAARASTTDAFYTDIPVVKAMYDGLEALGFTGGRMLEPSAGVGNFVGAMPSALSEKVKSWTMVELDGITGLIAKHLYPNSDVRIQGFEKTNIPDNYMDVVIGNVPFGENVSVYDKAYPKKVTSSIHNYFFAKAIDKVRPGGIVMFITATGTMNNRDSTVRNYIMKKADLLGAIRLPNTAFKSNAGTNVVADILILKKRADKTSYSGEDFLEVSYDYNIGEYTNTYFAQHPEMVLGVAERARAQYGWATTYKPIEGKGSLSDQIREAFSHIEGKMEYPATLSREKTNFAVERATRTTKENGLVVKDGKVYQNKGGELVEVSKANGAAERIAAMIEIRDLARNLMNYQQQGLNEAEIKKARTALNKAYDAFVKKYGFLNSQANRNAFSEDPDSYSLLALENWNPDTKKATKADIFSKNTIAPNRTVTSAKDVFEGLIVSVNQTGGVDTALIARLTGKTEAEVTRELIDSRKAFKNRNGNLETAETYLSGNVRAKLRDAEALVPIDGDYAHNVEALKAIMPEDVGYQEIFVNPGTPWIPNSVYSDFVAYMLDSRNTEWRQAVDVTRNAETGNFTVELKDRYLKTRSANTQKWGTNRRSFLELFDAMLNSKSVVVKDKLADGSFVINKDATAAANEKIENIQKEFQDWLWRDEARRAELTTLYNEVFNSVVTPKYNGESLTVNGMNAEKSLRPHQKDAVQRVISSGGNTLLAHRVGAGKTYEMAAAAMKLKELGLVKKPMFVVPKSLVAQWGKEFLDIFPTAKLLVAEAADFTASNRKVFMNRVANGEYDAVIVSYEQFEKLPMSDDFTRQLYQEQIDSIVAAIEEAKADKGAKALSVKDLEKKRKSLQAKIDKLTDKAKDEGNIDFEQLGVDSLFVDEAHNFKNLLYTTSMTNVAGLGNKDGSKRAFDLYTKVRYLQQLNGGRGIVFATATPVMNSMSEMYIMQKYLQPDLLNQLGLSTFDAWAKQFGEVVNGVEIKPSGQGYRVKQSFSRFKNMSELQLLFRNFADVLTDIPGLKIPKMKGGKVNVVVCEPGQFQQDFMGELEKRADNIKNVDPSEDNMLKITSDGRKISYTQRMIDPSLPYEEGCKIYRCAENVIKEYNESKAIKGTQIVFLDMATPRGKSNNTTETEDIETDMESAQLYDDLKTRLRQGGIPAKEIAFIHEADTDQKKKKLFEDVNEGRVRVLIGSTGKMGVGMNAQRRIVAIHHLDAPWRPGDVEQRDGRAFRQGNINEEVSKYTYVTEGSFDARLWDILERKQNFINQVMNGENVGRETEDTGEVTLSAAEVKALASGSPLILEQVQLDTDIKKLESLYRAHTSAIRSAKERLVRDNGQIATLQKQIENGKADVKATVDTYSDGKFSLTVGNKKFTDKKEAGAALMSEATDKANHYGYTKIGTFAGFELRVIRTIEGIKGQLVGKQEYEFKTYPGNTTFMISHLIGVVESIDEKVKAWQHNLAETQKDIAEQEKLIAEPFAKQAELDQKRARYNEVMAILNPKEEQSLDSVADDTVQEQSRAYLTAGGKAVMTQDRIDYLIEDSGAGKRQDYAQAWITSINPTDFLNLTLMKSNQNRELFDNMPGDYGSTVNNYDFIEGGLKKEKRQTPYLAIDVETGEVVGHEGRHRMRALEKEGVTYAEIKIEFRDSDGRLVKEKNGYGNPLESIDSLEIFNQRGTGQSAIIRNIIPLNEANRDNIIRHYGVANSDDIQYQQRTVALNDREVLAMAADALEATELTDAERDALKIFKSRLSRLEGLQEDRAEQGKLYKEQQFGANVDREAAKQTLNRMQVLDDQIKKAKADILSLENKEVLGSLLKKARKVVETEQRAHDAEIMKRYREREKEAAAVKKYRERIVADVDELSKWVLKPDNKNVVKHIPDVLKNTVIPFITSINFTSKQQLRGKEATNADKEFMKRLTALNSALKEQATVDGLYSGYTDLPPNFMERLQDFIDKVQDLVNQNSGEFVINKMTSEELKQLSEVVRNLKAYITQINKFHANAMYAHVYEAGDDTIAALSPMESDNGKSGKAHDFVFWQQIRPAYAFERFGRGGVAIYDGLRRGQAQLAFNTKKIIEFTKGTKDKEGAYTDKEVNAWEKEVKEIKISAGTVKMRISDMMSLYELSKQPDSLRHMLGEGMRVATYTVDGKKISDNGHALNKGDIKAIVNALTQRQKDVADAMQKFMAQQGGAWGNEVSVKRFGEEQFTNEQYFPINSDGRHLQSTADENPTEASLYALLNMSFTKTRNEKANNRIVIYSIFDVFANHMASMAQYNAMALPVLDAIKWFNYQYKTEDHEGNRYVKDSVREQMARVYGVADETRPGAGKKGYAESFVLNILKAFNGTEAQGVPTDTTGMNALRRYNMAQVAYNFRVVVQQPLAITRAALLLDYGSIIKGMKLKPAAIKQNIEEMQKYSGIAAWKSLGFYDTNISRGLTETIKHSTTVGQKIGEIGMWGAEKADTLTWAAMWSACKEEVIKKQGIKPTDGDFYEAVTELFEDVVYKTQVVDSVLTKNQFLRSKGLFARLTGSFMSESTATASMLIDAVDKYNTSLKRGMSRSQAWEKNKRMIGRTMYVYGVSAVILAAVQAVADAFRDDDDYEEWYEKWLEAFGGNFIDEFMPVNKLPIIADFYDFAKEVLSVFGVDTYGNPPQSVYMQWWDSLYNGIKIVWQNVTGEDTNYTYYSGIYKLLQAVSGITGLPGAAAMREIVTAWNNTVGAMAPSLKLKSYDSGDQNEIKYAYQDGYLTAEEATELLLEQGLVDNEDEAYFIVQGWEAGDGYSRYDKVYEAVRTGASVGEAMKELLSHGYTEKQVIGQIKGKIGEWYRGGEVSKQQATNMLNKYTEMSDEEITKLVNQWSCVVVTGIEYDDIDDEFMDGKITASRAIEMYMRYGGMTKEDATKKVTALSFVKEHPILEGESVSYSFVEAYNEYCEPQGIDVKLTYDVWKYAGSMESEKDDRGEIIVSKKEKVLEYIDSLDLSRKQKDALYYALGYAKSTIKEAPWR